MPKNIFFPISIVLVLIIGWMIFSPNAATTITDTGVGTTARIENGTQYIKILAKGGYSPKVQNAKANMPTILEVETNGTYDCTAALSIPTLAYRESLPATGTTRITITKEKATGTMDVLCSMGMFTSTINFIN